MNAGREMDTLVAEKVMGWQKVGPEIGGYLGKNAIGEFQTLPHYSTDIAAAWQVVEKMRETHWALVYGIGRPQALWRATFQRMSNVETGERFPEIERIAPTAPLAICLAALESVELSARRGAKDATEETA